MDKTIMSFDWAIKSVLRDKANFDVLSGFLTELLKRKIEVQEILESESNKDFDDSKTNKLDLIAKIDDGEIAIFEVQTTKEHDFFHRILFGTSRAIVDNLHKGQPYSKIPKVYSIDIVYFELGKGTDYVYHGTTNFVGLHNNDILKLNENERKILPLSPEAESASKVFPEYFIIYPNKFDEKIKSKFDEWVYVLKNSVVKSEFSAAGVQEAGEKLAELKMSRDERIRYDDYIKYERVRMGEIDTARFDGKEEGRAEGKEEGRIEGKAEGMAEGKVKANIENARKMKELGIPAEQISFITGLSVEDVGEL